MLLGRIDPTVVKALLGAQPQAERGAIGTIETFSVASAILAADTAVKSAKVDILELRAARGVGGKGIVYFTGEVADVTAACLLYTSHSKNIDNLSKFAREVETTIFVKNAPSYAGIGVGGEGHCTFTIAGPTGEGLTSARSFTRKRRCVMVDSFRIV